MKKTDLILRVVTGFCVGVRTRQVRGRFSLRPRCTTARCMTRCDACVKWLLRHHWLSRKWLYLILWIGFASSLCLVSAGFVAHLVRGFRAKYFMPFLFITCSVMCPIVTLLWFIFYQLRNLQGDVLSKHSKQMLLLDQFCCCLSPVYENNHVLPLNVSAFTLIKYY